MLVLAMQFSRDECGGRCRHVAITAPREQRSGSGPESACDAGQMGRRRCDSLKTEQ